MTDTFDAVLAELQLPETLRLHMGEMTPDEVRIAQAAVRFAHSHLAAARAAEVAEIEAQRDAAFAMSKCECASDECCMNLVRANARAEAAEARVRELEGLLIRARNPHAAKCPAAYRDSDTCTCGLDAALSTTPEAAQE